MPLNLVVQTAFLGDLLLSIPLLKRCKELWPNHKLALVCRKGMGDFFVKTQLVDQVFEIKKGDKESYRKIVEAIKSQEVDYLISPHQSLRTAFFVRQIKANHKIGFKNLPTFFAYDTQIQRDVRFPDALRQMTLLTEKDAELKGLLKDYLNQESPYVPKEFGRLSAPPSWASMSLRRAVMSRPELFLTLKEKFNLTGFEDGKAILIFPGSVWATKRWTEDGFIKAGQALKAQGYHVYIMGGPGEEELAERVATQVGVLSLAGRTAIFESAQLIARAALLIGNDSASTHLAAVCEVPLIAVFGPTILEFGYRPWSAQSYVVQMSQLPCRPCGKHGHKVCPIKTHVCMKAISADEVLKSAGFILRQNSL